MRASTLALMLLVHAAVVLGGVYLLLVEFGDVLDRELDDQVTNVQRDIETELGRTQRGVVQDFERALDERLSARGF